MDPRAPADAGASPPRPGPTPSPRHLSPGPDDLFASDEHRPVAGNATFGQTDRRGDSFSSHRGMTGNACGPPSTGGARCNSYSHCSPPSRSPRRPCRTSTAHKPLLRTVDLDRGESQLVELADGTRARVKLLDVEEERDGVRSAIRQARVKVEVNGQADDAGLRQLPPADHGRRRPDRLSGDQGLLQELRPVRGFLGPGQGRAAAALAGGLALGGAGDVHVPHQAALVRRRDADGQRAVVRRRRRRPDRPADLLPFRPGHRRLRGPGGGRLGVRRPGRLGGRQGPARVSRHPVLQARAITTTSTSSTPRGGSIATRT